jgi:hypothetical protein
MKLPFFPLAPLTVVLALLCGCGSDNVIKSGTVIRGKLLNKGVPLTAQNMDIGVGKIEIIFVPTEPSQEEFSTTANADGSYEYVGAGKGIAPGKYKVAVYQWDPYPVEDKLGNKFSKENTPITVDVPDKSSFTFDINLEKYGG